MKAKGIAVLAAAAAMTLMLSACDRDDGPAERAGEQIDEAVENAGQAIENAGDKIEDQTDR